MSERKPLSLDDKIYLVKIAKYRTSHLAIRDQRVCRDCARRECVTVCPVGTYSWEAERGAIHVAYENCFECGTCRIACPFENIGWENPPGGYGVEFRHG
jgi:ferredoxin like protein